MIGLIEIMADYTKQIFDMLGVEPDEEFALKEAPHCFFKITKSLKLWSCGAEKDVWFRDTHNTQFIDILTGKFTIIKIPKPTAEEQLVIDYARACGYKWLAKNKNKTVYMYSLKPTKGKYYWRPDINDFRHQPTYIPISFLSWENEEPFYIGYQLNKSDE